MEKPNDLKDEALAVNNSPPDWPFADKVLLAHVPVTANVTVIITIIVTVTVIPNSLP